MAFVTDTLPADRWDFDLPRTLYGAMRRRLELARSRARLLELEDRILADVGLDWAAAKAEGEKGFWS
ncbi:MAG: DUF1127 domain-containing protein [Alphaproteobacteria bacterium]|nr:DUF1127 domain-containing protein [Alphaproteobacteria bacterium]